MGDDLSDPAVVVVADAGDEMGLGHVSRSGAVAAALNELGMGVSCLGLGASAPFERDGMAWAPLASLDVIPASEVLVLDSYAPDREELERLADSSRLVLMHASGEVPGQVALVVTDALRDACLRPPFWDVPEREPRERIEHVLVTTGAGDPGGAGGRWAQAVLAQLPDVKVALVRGPQADPRVPEGVHPVVGSHSLADELLWADVVVAGAGQTMLEACAAGTPCIALPLAEDQRQQGEQAAELGAVLYVEEQGLLGALQQLAGSDARGELAQRARQVVDGKGALRVAERIARLVT